MIKRTEEEVEGYGGGRRDGELFPEEKEKAEYRELEAELERRKQEHRQQADFLTQLYNSVPCGIIQFSTDQDYTVVNVNRMVWKFYGYESEAEYCREVKSPLQLVRLEDRPWILGKIGSLTLNGPTVSYRRQGVRRDGQTVWVSVVMGRIVNADGLEVFQAVFTDITDMKRMEQEQRREQMIENQSLRAAICTAFPLIISVNLTKDAYQFFIEEQNVHMLPRQGCYSEMIRHFIPLAHPSCREDFAAMFDRDRVLKQFASGERDVYMEFRQLGRDGSYHWIAVQLIYVETPFKGVAIALVKGLDVQRAEQARQEQLLRDALASARAANQAKSDFLSRMSHDFRTPMNAIIGMSAIGQLKPDEPEQVQDCFRKIDASSRYLLSLINDILDMSKIENGKMNLVRKYFDFAELIGEIDQLIFPQAREKGIGYEIYHEEPLEQYYMGDALRVKQVLVNLLSNSLKFTARGGIEIRIRESRRTGGFAYVQFSVRDTGIGMSKDFLKRMFQPFEQESPEADRSHGGSGLGLSIVYNLVQIMGASIEAESEKGIGTVFTVTIPFRLPEAEVLKGEWRKNGELLKGLDVLVADDDPVVGCQCREMLSEAGANAIWVDSGAGAVKAVERHLEQGKSYDIAMLDWQMPDLNGLEAARQIRSMVGTDATIIMIAAYDWSVIEDKARRAGVDCFISKPLFRCSVYNAFGSVLGKHSPLTEQVEKTGFGHCRILLAEDNEMNREIAVTLLKIHGMEVEAARDGKEALALFQMKGEGYFNGVLMDVRMPVMDGLESARAIRSLNRPDAGRIPILAMTANASREDKLAALAAGMNGYLVKPLDVKAVMEELKKFV